jgi:hypothetical protein
LSSSVIADHPAGDAVEPEPVSGVAAAQGPDCVIAGRHGAAPYGGRMRGSRGAANAVVAGSGVTVWVLRRYTVGQ